MTPLLNFLLAAGVAAGGLWLVPASQAATKLFASVGRGSIALTTASGAKVSTLKTGTYLVVVRDRSPRENFHLMNPPLVDRKTRLAFVGVVTWRVRLEPYAVYQYFSDADKSSLHGSFRVR